MMSLTAPLPIRHMRSKEPVNWYRIQARVYGSYSQCLSVLLNQIFFPKEASWLPLQHSKPIQRLTSTLCKSLAIQSRVHASCPEHANSQNMPEKCLGDCSVDQGQNSPRTPKIQQYSLHCIAQELLKLLV